MNRIERITQSELVENKELFDIVNKIYLDKFPNEAYLSLNGLSDIIFFLYFKNDEIIGFGSYQENSVFYLMDCILPNDKTTEKLELAEYIISEIKSIDDNIMICAYQAEEHDRDFYINLGFSLYKDFSIQSPEMFESGLDLTRFVLELR